MSKMIDDFRSFAATDTDKNFFEPIKMAKDVLGLLEPQMKILGISSETHTLNSNPIVVKSYQNTVKRTLLNLIGNAKDAIEERKNTGDAFEPKIIVSAEIATTDAVRICVFNNGGNIKNAVMDRLFEPYFTTKEQGKGVGLGLYMSRLAMEETVGGSITATNKEDGVEFCITVPL
jgi:C4-dicarboxylate-specific signal transduction histidine kinase